MSEHDWCRDVARGEAVRAAEDAAAVPAIQHRDLPEQVALLWASLGDIIGRVVRLEGEMDAPRAAGEGGESNNPPEPESSPGPLAYMMAGPFEKRVFRTREEVYAYQRGLGPIEAASMIFVPLYAAPVAASATTPPEPRGWLTAEEREAVLAARDYFDNGGLIREDECVFIARMLKQLFARSTPPMVRRPNPNVVITTVDARERIDRQWIAAIRAAGGEVE